MRKLFSKKEEDISFSNTINEIKFLKKGNGFFESDVW